MSLRLRLTLVILSVVTLMGVVGVMSFRINSGVQRQVAQLSRMTMAGLDKEPLVGQAVEIEGYWETKGFFIATALEKLPRSRRPKLRGEIREIDQANKSFTMFGVQIRVNDDTEFLHTERKADPFGSLKPGRRVEASCKVDSEGHWIARKIKTRGVKKSDKIKGTVTRADTDRGNQYLIEIHGLKILVDRGIAVTNPRSSLHRMETATRMIHSIRECLAAGHALLEGALSEEGFLNTGEVDRAAKVHALVGDAKDRFIDGYEDFVHYLSESRSSAEEAIRAASGDGGLDGPAGADREKILVWLEPLGRERVVFEKNVSTFLNLATRDPEKARGFLRDVLEPHLGEDILPLVQAYHLETEEDLSDELQSLSSRSDAAGRLAIGVNAAGFFLALALGLVVSRSISNPIQALNAAARKIGEGNLGTRVDVRSKDELGALASSFNRMAEDLAASTVSVSNLNSVIDSMAGALIILSRDANITNVNPAALTLLGYEEGDLRGRPFETICPNGEHGRVGSLIGSMEQGTVGVMDKVFIRKDGTEILVSFSGAAMRDKAGSVSGFVCVAQDLTERKAMEEQLRRSLSEKELLLKEVHHRVKNNLQVISSLLDLQSRTITDPNSMEKFQESQDRIRSMVYIHEQLYQTRDLERIDLRSYLELLTAHLAQSYVSPPKRIRFEVRVEDLSLDLDRALPCGLIVNELVTNAFKHAFPEDNGGEILVSFGLSEEGNCVLQVSDNGRGIHTDLDPEANASLGLRLVDTLVRQLRGRLRMNNHGGASFRVEFPMQKTLEEVA